MFHPRQCGVEHSVGKSPFVVIPSQDLGEITKHFGVVQIHNGARRLLSEKQAIAEKKASHDKQDDTTDLFVGFSNTWPVGIPQGRCAASACLAAAHFFGSVLFAVLIQRL